MLEGSIAEGYLADECLTFCSRYLDDELETKFNRVGRNSDGDNTTSLGKFSIFLGAGRVLGKQVSFRNLTGEEWEQARLYVLRNCDEVIPFIEEHKKSIRDDHGGGIRPMDVDRIHNEEFVGWFERHVRKMKQKGEVVNEQLDILSFGPRRTACCYKGYLVNGFRFHTKDYDRMRKTQNSGVSVNAETSSFASTRDSNPVTGNVGYYGVLDDIVVLQYREGNQIVLFKCHWWDVLSRSGIKRDEYGFTSLNFRRTIALNEPFIFAAQAQQVFYVQDNLDKNWRVVLKMQARDTYDMGLEVEPVQEDSTCTNNDAIYDLVETIVESWTRDEIEGVEVTTSSTERDQSTIDNYDSDKEFINDNRINSGSSDDEQGQHSNSASNARRTRGPTRLLKLMAKPPGSQKVLLEWDEKGRPIGGNQVLYSESIGVLLTMDHRFNWTKHWDEQDEDDKDWLWANMKELWDVDDDHKEFTLNTITSKIFKNKKSQWKAGHYSSHTTDEERVADRPLVLSSEEWGDLVNHWNSPEHQKIAKRNKENRSKQKVKHSAGRKSFPRCKADMAKKNGAVPSQGDFFVETHTSKKTNDALDEVSRDYIARMREQAGQDEDGHHLPIPDEVYRNVMPDERHGRVRGEGLGVTPTTFRSQTSLSATNSTRINDLDKEVSELKRKIKEKDEEMEKRIKERDDEYERRMKERDDEYERRRKERDNQIEQQNLERERLMMEKVQEMIGLRSQPV